MSDALAEKPLDNRPLRIVADWRMMFASLSSNVKMSVASEAGTLATSGGGAVESADASTGGCFLPFL